MHTKHSLGPIPLTKGGAGVVIWVIIAAVVVGGGYLAVQKSKRKMENAEPVVKQAVTMTGQKEAEPQAVVPADWNTYRNEQYGFEFRYPKGWTVREVVPSSDMSESWKSYAFYASYTRPNGQDHSGFVAVSKKGIDELTKDEPYIFSKLTYETERFADTEATKVVSRFTNSDTGYSSNSFDYFIVKDGYTYIITGTATSNKDEPIEAKTREIQNSVLSTFRFTK